MNAIRHLAQLNIGRFRYPTDDPRVAAAQLWKTARCAPDGQAA
jgi:hypothetical protein